MDEFGHLNLSSLKLQILISWYQLQCIELKQEEKESWLFSETTRKGEKVLSQFSEYQSQLSLSSDIEEMLACSIWLVPLHDVREGVASDGVMLIFCSGSVRSSRSGNICLSVTVIVCLELSIFLFLSKVSLRAPSAYFVGPTEPKILQYCVCYFYSRLGVSDDDIQPRIQPWLTEV